MGVKGVIRGVAVRVARRVVRHDLFEQEGERVPSPTLPPLEVSLPIQIETATAPEEVSNSGVRAVNIQGLGPALDPGGGLRIVNHWATWCSGCVEELPELLRLREGIDPAVKFFGISWDRFQATGSVADTFSEITETMARHSLCWPTLLLQDGVAPEALFDALKMRCQTVPQTWLVDDQGTVLHQIDGPLDSRVTDDLIARVKALR